MNMHRREFLRQAAATTLAAGAIGSRATAASPSDPPAAGELPRGPIVDTHQHLWDLDVVHLRWVKSSEQLNRSFVTEDYLEATRGLEIAQAIYMEVAAEESELDAEADYVLGLCRQADKPTKAVVIGGRPGTAAFAPYIRRHAQSPQVKGVRWILPADAIQKGFPRSKPFLDDLGLLGELGLRFDLCMPPQSLAEGVKIVDRCPGTRFVLDHCGNADPNWFRSPEQKDAIEQWRRDVAELGRRDRVVCKISGIVSRVPSDWTPDDLAPIVEHCLESFGPDRVVFASDWPVCTRGASLLQWAAALHAIVGQRPADQQRKLWHDNAVRFYGPGLPRCKSARFSEVLSISGGF
jgi:predicted TIM-barrel fold metal-dependent hydrolase